MKFTKKAIREMVSTYGRPEILPDDGFHQLSAGIESSITEGSMPHYHRSKYCLFFEQLVVHRPQEAEAVKDNVATSIHNALYREIVVSLQSIKHESKYATREEIQNMLDKLIKRVEE